MPTTNEVQKLVELLRKIDAHNLDLGLPLEVFDVLTKIVPFVSCELAVVNDKKELLLTRRDDQYWHGWHFPGGLIRFRESFGERIHAVARKELGVHVSGYDFIQPFNYLDDPRGHSVNLLFLGRITGEPKDGRWFSEPPADIIVHHRELFTKALEFIFK